MRGKICFRSHRTCLGIIAAEEWSGGELLTSWLKGSQRQNQARCSPTGSLSDLLPAARSHLLKFPQSPRIALVAGSSPSAHELMGSFHSKSIPEILVILKVEIRVPGNIDLFNRKLAFKVDFSSC